MNPVSKTLSPTLAILKTYFGSVLPLGAYLEKYTKQGFELLPDAQCCDADLKELLLSAYICEEEKPREPFLKLSLAGCDMREACQQQVMKG
jgi:hypothetical protein